MSKTNNVQDLLRSVADAIRDMDGTTATINPQNFETKIKQIPAVFNLQLGDTTGTFNFIGSESSYPKPRTVGTLTGPTLTANIKYEGKTVAVNSQFNSVNTVIAAMQSAVAASEPVTLKNGSYELTIYYHRVAPQNLYPSSTTIKPNTEYTASTGSEEWGTTNVTVSGFDASKKYVNLITSVNTSNHTLKFKLIEV